MTTDASIYDDEPVRIVRYDAEWPSRFEAERLLLAGFLAQTSFAWWT